MAELSKQSPSAGPRRRSGQFVADGSAGGRRNGDIGQGPDGDGANGLLEPNEADDARRNQQKLQALTEAIAAAEQEGGYVAARRAFETRSGDIPASQLWRTHLELAECAKRSADLTNVKFHFLWALRAQPCMPQVLVEACRTFDEVGEPAESCTLLKKVLDEQRGPVPNEQLVLKLVRVFERLGDYTALRALIGSLRNELPERIAKVTAEAVHIEVRKGNGETASAVLRCLALRLPNQGPVHYEACRAENALGNCRVALTIAEHGTRSCPKYGPLWLALLRLAERVYGAASTKEYSMFALRNVCRELHWKLHFEVAGAFARAGDGPNCRKAMSAAALSCPKHLRWKVWLLGARSELSDRTIAASRKLLARARVDAPLRMQAAVCIEQGWMEEFLGNDEAARAAFEEAHSYEGDDWRVYLEHIFMEARQRGVVAAREVARSALELHPATGRLWSALVALEHCGAAGSPASDLALVTFRRALTEVPKSGEVWCEGARIFMNPVGGHFHLARARKCLEFAVHLTPQYGDSFLELLRLRLLLDLSARMRADPLAIGFLGGPSVGASSQPPGPCDAGRCAALAALVARRACVAVLKAGGLGCENEVRGAEVPTAEAAVSRGVDAAVADPKSRGSDGSVPRVDLAQLEVVCHYADPNYGFLWFWCRETSVSTPREVLFRMHTEVTSDLAKGELLWVYAWAIACDMFGLPAPREGENGQCASMPTGDPSHGGCNFAAVDFSVGSLHLSRCFANKETPFDKVDRRRLIFGSDILSG